MNWALDPQMWLSLLTLTVLEIVLGIDNIIFIAILAGKLPSDRQASARSLGLMLGLVCRVLLLCSVFWLTRLTKVLFEVAGHGFSGKDLVMLGGGVFLIWKSVKEVHGALEGGDHEHTSRVRASFGAVIAQIVLIDIVFSLDSVITAVGVAQQIGVMIAAVMLAMGVMLAASGSISAFVQRHPTVKMLALSFLMMVGVMLVAEGCGQHINKGYIYFAMAFSFLVETLNIRARTKAKAKPVELHSEF